MNHAQIATEALRFRLTMVRRTASDEREWDLDAMAAASVTAAEPEVDGAIRQIATAWIRSGFDPDDLTRPWTGGRIERLFSQRPDLVDALDAIVRAATRVTAA
jgi:hypothetical protein